MASYEEIFDLRNYSPLKNKVTTAVLIAAETIINEDPGTTNHANRLTWAKKVFTNPRVEADRMFMAMLAANKDATVSNIQNATDASIQTNVDAHIDLFADGS